jgi:hypothetical protein
LTSENFARILSQFTAHCDADILSGYAKIVNGTIHSGIQQDVTPQLRVTALLQAGNDSRLSLFVVVEISSGSNSVLLLSLWKIHESSVQRVCNSPYSQFNGLTMSTADIHCC